MPAGFYCLNDAGTVLIDDTNYNVAMVIRGTSDVAIFTPAPGVFVYSWVVDISAPGFVAPIVAFACSDDYASVNRPQTINSSGMRCRSFAFSGAVNKPVKWAIFDRPVAPSSSSSGAMQIFAADASLCFDSRLKHPVIATVIVPTVVGTVYTATLPSGREYMCASDNVAVKIVSNVISVVQNNSLMIGRPCVIIDVTGY